MLTVFDWLQGMAAVGALEFQGRCYFLTVDKGLAADFAFKLTAPAGVIIDVFMRSTAERTYGIFRDSAGLAILSFDRFNCFAVAKPVILVPEQPVLFDERLNDRQLIREEFLVFGAVDLIMSPLFERNVSADKENKPANSVVLFLNDSK